MSFDYSRVGRRIAQERKNYKHVTQEKMAEELRMYQADISNLENGKLGSGINDIAKLDIIADYLGISVKELIMSAFDDEIYIRDEHLHDISALISDSWNITSQNLFVLEHSPYITYILEKPNEKSSKLMTLCSFVFYGDKLISHTMTSMCR